MSNLFYRRPNSRKTHIWFPVFFAITFKHFFLSLKGYGFRLSFHKQHHQSHLLKHKVTTPAFEKMLREMTPCGVSEGVKTQNQGRNLTSECCHRPDTATKTLSLQKILPLVANKGGLPFQWEHLGAVAVCRAGIKGKGDAGAKGKFHPPLSPLSLKTVKRE